MRNHRTRFRRVLLGVSLAVLALAVVRPVSGQSVVINEFLASNQAGLVDGNGDTSDWIELYNAGRATVSLAGWHLTDSPGNLRKWTFPAGIVLPVGQYLVVFASGRAVGPGIYVDGKGYLHTNFSLDKDGEYLALAAPDGAVVHAYIPRYPSQQTDVSHGLYQGAYRYFSPPTPGKANGPGFPGFVEPIIHSPERGFYDQPFALRLSCDTPEALIRYTLDGSEPTAQHGTIYQSGAPILITTTTTVRSAAFRTGWRTAQATTHTYLFVDHVARQPAHPPGWPADWGYDAEVRGIVPADYAMDPRVVNNTRPGYSVRAALLDIPTVSLAMLPDDFISHATGVWANPLSRWERKCSVEYILPDGGAGFQHDCKIEAHGNSSRRPWRMQKHSLRLTFTSQYGPAKLHYPLFASSPVTEFNQLVLRAGFTDSWALVTWVPSRYRPNDSQYLRDVWMKESLGAMGQPSSHGSFVHVYVNGLYFGVFNLAERVAADFFAAHLGGQPEDWEINEDLASSGPRWNAMLAVNPATAAGYAQMQQYVDAANFADYMLLHFYADAEDWPQHNGYAAANAKSGDGKFRFFVWDQEIVLDYHGRAATRIDATGGAGALFQKLRANEDFRLLFADRVYQHCFNDGALSVAASQERYRTVAGWLDKAIVAESARWGDVQMTTPYGNQIEQPSPFTDINHILYPPAPHGPDYYFTREDSWIVERDNVINNYLPAIHNLANSYALVRVLRAENLYPSLDPPLFRINGVPQHGGPVAPGAALTLTNPNGSGTIYYSLDGSDPRLAVPGAPPGAKTLVGEPAAKQVLIPARQIGTAWRNVGYNDPHWIEGAGGVGYERSSGYEPYLGLDVGAQMYGVNASCYLRIPFTVAAADLQNPTGLILKCRYDDGFVAWLNGVEVARDRFLGVPQWNSAAAGSRPDAEAVQLTDFDLTAHIGLLRTGDNLLAIHGLNDSPTSSDFLISAALVTAPATPPAHPNPAHGPTPYTAPIPLAQLTHIKARILDRGQWSALHEATYETAAEN